MPMSPVTTASGLLSPTSSRSELLTLERLDVGQFQPILTILGTQPHVATPNSLDSYTITIRNDGYGTATGFSLVALFPEWADFVSASGSYVLYNVASYRSTHLYAPRPFLRWDIPQIPPRSVLKFNYQGRFRLPVQDGPVGHDELSMGSVQLVGTPWANQLFSIYPAGGTQ